MSFHTIILVGNLGQDPELRYTPNDKAVCNMSVATNRVYTGGDGEPVKETVWWRVAVWGKQAENAAKYLKKGRRVLVEGQIRPDPDTGGPRVYQKNDETYGASYELNASVVRFMDSPSNGDSEEAAEGEGIPF